MLTTWNHRNPDRLGGVKHEIDEFVAFLGESTTGTGGRLRAVPERLQSCQTAVGTRVHRSVKDRSSVAMSASG